jgi:hypothetical protein
MIYCVAVPVAVPVPFPDTDLLSTVFQQQNFLYKKSCLSNARNSIVSQKISLYLLIFDCCITGTFMLDPSPNLVPEPECITVPVPLRQKVAVPVTIPVP